MFESRFGERPTSTLEVAADGSQRAYWRLLGPDGRTAIGATGPEPEENRAFLSFSRAFRGIGLPVPEIYDADESAGAWLMEDLGETTLFDALVSARATAGGAFPASMVATYRDVLAVLPRFQIDGHAAVDYAAAYPRAAFDRQSILWDLAYFKYHFLKLAGIPFHEARLERDFDALADFLLEAPLDSFLYRDFQSRNVMLRDGEPWFVDYQGGRRGALHYDVASLLYDAKADLPEAVRAELLEHYLDVLSERIDVDRSEFRARFGGYVVVRVMQAMGAYGYRGFFERRPRFLESVPYAAANIRHILEAGLPVTLPEVEAAFGRIVDEFAPPPGRGGPAAGLTVRVSSFSYRRGYPRDDGGHGGGFVFDCRALPNPGREDLYKSLCGLDEPVRGFIDGMPEAGAFYQRTRALVETQVEVYRERGFSSLSVAYGCTGGQHRSVYFAERLARDLEARFPDLAVEVFHREQPLWPAREPVGARRDDGGAAGTPWTP